jgi:hypothetical protein
MSVDVIGDALVDRREDMVRDDPRVRQAERIAEAAKIRLMTAVDAGDARESWRLMEVFGRAMLLQRETEDDVRVRAGLLTPAQAALRRVARRADLAAPAARCRRAGPAARLLAAAGAWLAVAGAWLTALAAGRRARQGPCRPAAGGWPGGAG